MQHDFIKDTTDYIFLKDEPQVSDVIFIPGSMCYLLPERAAELYRDGMARYIIPSGKYSVVTNTLSRQNPDEKYHGDWSSEAEFFAHVLKENGVPAEAIYTECESTYTYQNALNTKALTDRLGIRVDRAILCCRSYHARRAYTYYSRVFTDTEIFVCPVEHGDACRDNWYKNEVGIKRVAGEIQRITEQLMKPGEMK